MLNFQYYSSVPDYVKQDFDRYGYHFEDCKDPFNTNVIFYEHDIPFIIENIEQLKHNKHIIIIDHHFVQHNRLLKLDSLVEKDTVILIGTQYVKQLYKNLTTLQIGSSELWCKHDVMKYVIDSWITKRKWSVSNPWLLLSAHGTMPFHKSRNHFIDNLKIKLGNKIFTNPTTGPDLWDRKREFDDWIEETFGNRNMLGGFGSGLPRFDFYDATSAELVLETIYETETVHLSEKTWRPIACKVPALFLLNSANLKYLNDLGYKTSSTFYKELEQCKNYTDVLLLITAQIDKQDFTILQQDAEYNYNHFWRYHSVWSDYVPNLKKVFGHSPIEDISIRLNKV